MTGTPFSDDSDFIAQRDEAFALAETVLCGRYSLEVVAKVCAALMCHAIGSSGAEIHEAQNLIDDIVDDAIDAMRRNWATLQHAHQPISEPTGGNA